MKPGKELTGKELCLSWGALAVLGILVYLPHVIHGGFVLDDWSGSARTLYSSEGSGFWSAVGYYGSVTLFRPVLVFYVPVVYSVFGMHMWMHLAWAASLGFAVAALLYGVLRTLRLPWFHALAISGLVLIYPWYDSTRLWPTGAQIALSTAIALGGLWVALVGLSRDSWRLHAAAAALFLTSILTYEIALPSIAAFGLIYVWRFGWERAKWRWAVDLAVVIVGGTWVLTNTTRTSSGLSGDFHHLRMIISGGAEILGRTAIPVGSQRTALALILIGLVLLCGLIALRIRPDRDREDGGVGMAGWLTCAGAGLAVMVLGWVIFVPADPYYTPSIFGVTNRVNGVGGIGAVILVYATFGVLGTLIMRAIRGRGVAFGLAVTLLLGCVLGVGYLTVIRRHIGIWNSAFQAEAVAMKKIKARYPTLPSRTTVFSTDYPMNQTWGVPILSTSWDLQGMVRDEYRDGTLTADPLLPGTGLVCLPEGMQLRVLDESGAPTGELIINARSYRLVRIIDLEDEASFRPVDQASCEAATKQVGPGPEVLSRTY